MNQLLAEILHAHSGMSRWNEYHKVEATIVSGGGLFQLKGIPQDPAPRRMSVWLHEERSSVFRFGAPDQRTMFTPERIAIEKLDGTVVAQRHAPKDSFAGHQMNTPWDPLHRAYFNGEALWTYLTTPFLPAMEGVRVEDTSSFIIEIVKIARKFAEPANSRRFLSSVEFLFSLSDSRYSLWCSLVIDTKQTPNFLYSPLRQRRSAIGSRSVIQPSQTFQ